MDFTWLPLDIDEETWHIGHWYIPVFLYGAETWSMTKAIEKWSDGLDQWCLWRILNIAWSERVTNSEVRRRTRQPLDTVVCPRGPGRQVPGSLLCSPSMHIAHSKELESRTSIAYLAENGGGRSAPIQPRPRVRVSKGTEQIIEHSQDELQWIFRFTNSSGHEQVTSVYCSCTSCYSICCLHSKWWLE